MRDTSAKTSHAPPAWAGTTRPPGRGNALHRLAWAALVVMPLLSGCSGGGNDNAAPGNSNWDQLKWDQDKWS